MIISHKYKFIFIKTVKTAGTSIQHSLQEQCGPHDIVTPISPASNGYISRNHRGWETHDGCNKIIKNIDRNIWINYKKITVERNPWDKTISWFYWICKTTKHNRWNAILGGKNPFHRTNVIPTIKFFRQGKWLALVDNVLPTDFSKYSINGKVIADYVIQYDSLQDDYDHMCKELGLITRQLPKLKAIRKDKDYRSFFNVSPDLKEIVARRFKREINEFKYKY